LPWRRTTDPYAILVSEFMCQQTTVAAVVPHFERWMRRFPNPASLAAASEHDVLKHWEGLGYYSRARNLHRAAKSLAPDFPKTVKALRGLRGVGPYTAAAVAAFAFDAPEPVVDANIARVLARLVNCHDPIDTPAGRKFLDAAARALLPKSGGRLHNSALMELGALVCLPRSPRCDICPVRAHCRADRPSEIPVKRPRPIIEEIRERRAFFLLDDFIWLERSEGPRWHGLWILPLATGPGRRLHVASYPITRFRVEMSVVSASHPPDHLSAFPLGALPPMPSPHRRAIEAILKMPRNPQKMRRSFPQLHDRP